MADRVQILETLERAHEARLAGDLEATLAVFAPDASYRNAGVRELLPESLPITGHATLRTALAAQIATFKLSNRERLNTVVEGDKAAVHWRVQVIDPHDGQSITTDLFDLWTLDAQGWPVSFVQFADTALMAKLAS